jgi:hypothetical protein
MDVRFILFVPLMLVGCGPLVEQYQGHEYLFVAPHQKVKTWVGAREDCASRGYHLVDIEDADENVWVSAVAGVYESTDWWLGLNDRDEEGVWVWESGSPAEFTTWESGAPGPTPNRDCCMISSWGNWDSGGPAGSVWQHERCGDRYSYICERTRR